MSIRERQQVRTARISELGRNKLSNEVIRDTVNLEFTDIPAITARTVAAKLHEAGIPARSNTDPEAEALKPHDIGVEKRVAGLERQAHFWKSEYDRSIKKESLADRIVEAVVGEVQVAPPLAPVLHFKDKEGGSSYEDAVLLLSCWHQGEIVDPEATMGLGNYNERIAAARAQYLAESVIDLSFNHQRGQVRRLYVVNTGDTTSGNIHEELNVTNEYPPAVQMVRAARLQTAFIRDLVPHFEEVIYIGLCGNHGRFVKKPSFKQHYDNADFVVYKMLEQSLERQDNVRFIIPRSPWHTENINGHEFFFAHGDGIKMYYKFPYYDARSFIQGMGSMLMQGGHTVPRYWGFGHFHTGNISQLSYGEWCFTGSLKGPDEYSIGKLREGTPPMQQFFGVHARRGMSFRYPIVVEDGDPAIHNRYWAALSDGHEDELWTPS